MLAGACRQTFLVLRQPPVWSALVLLGCWSSVGRACSRGLPVPAWHPLLVAGESRCHVSSSLPLSSREVAQSKPLADEVRALSCLTPCYTFELL